MHRLRIRGIRIIRSLDRKEVLLCLETQTDALDVDESHDATSREVALDTICRLTNTAWPEGRFVPRARHKALGVLLE